MEEQKEVSAKVAEKALAKAAAEVAEAAEKVAEKVAAERNTEVADSLPSLEEIRKMFADDKFATEAAAAVITEAGVRHAKCEMELTPVHLNARGAVMGGALFTLADFTAAVAAEGYKAELDSVSLDANITYFAPAKGTKVIAEATCIKAGRTTSYYEVQLTDDVGTNVAKFTCNMFTIRKNAQ